MTISPTETDLKILVQSEPKLQPMTTTDSAGASQDTSHAPMRVLMSLDQLPVGAKGMISSVAGETPLRRRLLEMGLEPGIIVQLIRRAPMGDPLEIQVRDYQLSLRGDQAKLITVIAI